MKEAKKSKKKPLIRKYPLRDKDGIIAEAEKTITRLNRTPKPSLNSYIIEAIAAYNKANKPDL